MRDGAARGRRPPLRRAERRRRTAPSRCSCSSSASAPASIRSRARSSGRRRTSTRRSSRSGAPALPDDYARVKKVVGAAFAHRRKTLPNSLELAGLASREQRRRRRSSRSAASAATRAEALAPPEFVALARGARVRASAPAKINLALVVGPLRDDGKHEVVTVYQRVGLADRIDVEPADALARRRLRRRHARPRRARAARAHAGVEPRWHATIEKRHPGRGRARRRQLRRRDGAAARERDARRAAAARASCTSSRPRLGADVPFFLADGPQLGTGDGTTLAPLDLPQDFWVLLVLPTARDKAVDRGRLRGVRRARRRRRLGRAPRRAARRARPRPAPARPRRAAAERPRVVAARRRAADARRVPRRRQRRRPDGLRALPPRGAGEGREACARAAGRHLADGTCVVRLNRGERLSARRRARLEQRRALAPRTRRTRLALWIAVARGDRRRRSRTTSRSGP